MNVQVLNICPVKNGWAIFIATEACSMQGYVLPSYVFNTAREAANAVHELLVRGTLDEPAKTFPEIVETHAPEGISGLTHGHE